MRDDIETMSSFSDEVNDHYLWDGWLTYQGLTHRLPPEAQVFQVWWLALYPDIFAKLTPTAASFFPNIQLDSRPEQKRRLKRATERTRKAPEILSDKRTELTQLMLKWP